MSVSNKAAKDLAAFYAAAWSSKDGTKVAAYYEPDGKVVMNNGDAHVGHTAIAEMAAGFHTTFPDMHLVCDTFRVSGTHALFAWTFYGHHIETKNFVKLSGWEEWKLSANTKVQTSCCWFDADDFDSQIFGNKG